MIKHLFSALTLSIFTIAQPVMAQLEENQDTTQSTIVKMYSDIEAFKRLKISGYIHAQFQYADSFGITSFSSGSFPSGTDKRFSIRRGRVKFQYDALANQKGIVTSSYVLGFDVTEKGLLIIDVFAKLTDPWIGWFSITAGKQNRPFGFEIPYSSSMRETPERGRMSQIIFPGERDLGAMLTIQGPKTSLYNWIKLDAGMFNGGGTRGPGVDGSEFDKFKDFIGHLSITRSTPSEKIKYALGASYYYGGFRIDTVNVYAVGVDVNGVNGFVKENSKSDFYGVSIGNRKEAIREYIGFDAQLSVDWKPGITTIRGEYIQGDQPGFTPTSTLSAAAATASPNAANNADIYKRPFNGAYFYFVQNILQTPVQLVVKYDWYDPNTKVSGDDIGKSVASSNKAFSAADIKYDTWGFGLAYRWDANLKLSAYYEIVKNETTKNVAADNGDLADNVLTIRLQVRF